MLYDVLIVGAGPAGLFAADTLSSHGYKVAIIDKGREIEERSCPKEKNSNAVCNCNPCNIYSGMGGAGGKSDGKLNFHPTIGGDLYQFTPEPYKYIKIVDEVFTEISGVTEYSTQRVDAESLIQKALQNGQEFVLIDQKHIGSDRLVSVMKRFKRRLMDKNVDFFFMTNVVDISANNGSADGVFIRRNGSTEKISSKSVIICPGREGSNWFKQISLKHNIYLTHLPIDVGIRVETLNQITKPVTDVQYCPKIRMLYMDALIRTFCFNPEGFVVTENYGDYYLVNGHAEKDRKSKNCNFAVLYRVSLTKPRTNTTEYGMNIAKMFNHLGRQKPIVQRLADLKIGRRSTEERLAYSNVKPTLKDAVPGDISLGMPDKIMKGLLHFLKRLDVLMPGIFQGSNTLLYAPEIKFQSMRGDVDKNMESSVSNLFFAGDGCGLTGGIVQSAVTGILAAEGIIRKNSDLGGLSAMKNIIANKKAVVYDMDNTLVASDLFVQEHIIETLRGLDLPVSVSLDDIRAVQKLNLPFAEIFKRLFKEDGEKILAEYRKNAYEKPFHETNGAIRFVNKIRSRGLFQGIVTNRTVMAEERLKQAGFSDFDFIHSPPSAELSKPHPKAFDLALDWLDKRNVSTKEVVVFGDHIHDYLAARDAGLSFFAVLTGQTTEQDFADAGLSKDRIFADFSKAILSLDKGVV